MNTTAEEISKYTWENYGDTLFPKKEKFTLTKLEKVIIKVLLYKYRPPLKYRQKVTSSIFLTLLPSYG